MNFHFFLTCLAFCQLSTAQIVSPFATHDCSKQVFSTGDHACFNDLTKCCAATGVCCAGGCCPFDAYCVFSGTAKEACCSLSDKTQCGAAPPPSTVSCAPNSAPSVPCSGLSSSWYCRPGCSCNVSIKGGCNCFTGNCIPAGGGGSSSSVQLVPSSTSTSAKSTPSSSASRSTTSSSTTPTSSSTTSSGTVSSGSVVSSQAPFSEFTSSVAESPRTSTQTVQPSNVGGASSSAAAATTTRASEGVMVELKGFWGLFSNLLVLGIMLIL